MRNYFLLHLGKGDLKKALNAKKINVAVTIIITRNRHVIDSALPHKLTGALDGPQSSDGVPGAEP